MSINEKIKELMKEEGRTQHWVANEMNKYDPAIRMSNVKFSAIVTGKRAISAKELLAFCAATGRSPEEFMPGKTMSA